MFGCLGHKDLKKTHTGCTVSLVDSTYKSTMVTGLSLASPLSLAVKLPFVGKKQHKRCFLIERNHMLEQLYRIMF